MMSTELEQMWGPDEEQALLDSIDNWVEKSVAPIAQEYDLEDKYPHQALMAGLPTAIIVHDRPALAGLVDFARRPDTFGLRLDGRHWRA